MADFLTAFQITNKNEGKLANNPNDAGKLTYMGIASAFWPNWKGWPIINEAIANHTTAILSKNATLQQYVQDFYKQNFWNPLSLMWFNDQQLANVVYDFGVNSGIGNSARKLQLAANQIGGDLSVDGQIGAK